MVLGHWRTFCKERYKVCSGPICRILEADKDLGGTPVAYSVVSQKSGKTYYLHSRNVTLRGGREQTIYFFAQTEKDGVLDALPAGYEVSENPRTGLPLLKKAS